MDAEQKKISVSYVSHFTDEKMETQKLGHGYMTFVSSNIK